MFLPTNSEASGGVVKLSGGKEIHDEIVGDGPETVIMLHGLGGGREAYRWAVPLANQLGLRLLFPWLPCHGPSSDVDTFSEAVYLLSQYREVRGATDSLVMGHSFGGALATAMCADSGRALPMAAPLSPRFIGMSWPEVQFRLGWVALDLLTCITTGAMESTLRLDIHRYAPAVTRTLLAGSRINLGIRVLKSMPDLTPHTRQACDLGRPPLRLWGLADLGVSMPPFGLLPGDDWYLPWVAHADFAFRTSYPYPFIRRAVQVSLGRAQPLKVPLFTQRAV